jgi:FAD/FMN-containing dehydrogenase
MTATLTGTRIAPEAIEQLRAGVRGTVITPDDPGFDEARAVYNAMIDKKPALVVQAVDVADVIAGVKFAGEQDLPISERGAGHNYAWQGT